MRPSTRHAAAARRAGFSMLEMIVVIAIMAVIAGAAVPVTSKVLTYQARKATRGELQLLSDASAEFFRDTRTLPADLADLGLGNVEGFLDPIAQNGARLARIDDIDHRELLRRAEGRRKFRIVLFQLCQPRVRIVCGFQFLAVRGPYAAFERN